MKPVAKAAVRARPGLVAVAVGVGLIAAAAHLPALRNGLVWDDVALVQRSRVGPIAAFGRSFWQDSAESLDSDPYYRPLVNSSLALQRVLAGRQAWHFHFVNVLLHGAVVGLFAWLVGTLAGSVAAAGIAGLLFGLHPLLADSVAYVSGRTDLLAGLGVVVAAVGLWRQLRRPGWPGVAVVLVGFAVATFSKESGLLLLLPVGAGLLLRPGRTRGQRSDWIAAAGLVVVAAGYLAARWSVLGGLTGMRLAGTPGEVVGLTLNEFGRGLVRFMFPFGQRLFEWRGAVSSRLDAYSVAAFVFMLLPAVLVRFRPRVTLLTAWAWALLFLLPFAGLSQFGPTGRLLYLPGMGIVALLVFASLQITKRSRFGQRVGAAFAAGLAVAFVPFLVGRTAAWHDDVVLFGRMAREAPAYAPGHFNYGSALAARGDLAGAADEFSRALALDSNLVQACLNLGALRQQQGGLAEAATLYRRAVKSRPDYAAARVNLGIVLHKLGDGPGAVSELRRALELDPGSAGAAFNLAWLFYIKGESDSALRYAGIAFQLAPEDVRVRGLFERVRAGQLVPTGR